MNEPEYEIHPLDRDYSSPVQASQRPAVGFDAKLRRIGISVFAAGFALLFLVALVLGSFPGSGRIESIGSSTHRFAMLMILVGGTGIIVAYRLPHLKKGNVGLRRGAFSWNVARSYWALVVWNLVALVAITLAAQLLRLILPGALTFFLVNAALTLTCAWLATVAVSHRGHLRGYAIGVLVALLINTYSSFLGINGWYWANRGYLLFAHLCLVLASGLICAAYVHWLPSGDGRQSSDRGQGPK